VLLAYLIVAASDVPAAPLPIAPPPPAPFLTWPGDRPGRVISSPNWSDYRNYPVEALKNDDEGSVAFTLLINPSGKPTECAIRESSGSASLDAGSCAIAMKMRFEPARGPNGKAITSTYRSRVFWLLQDPRPFASSTMDAELVFDGDHLTSCIAQGSGPYFQPWKSIVCGDAQIYPKKFETRGGIPSKVALSIRLDAGDGTLTKPNWPAGPMLARDYATFTINSEGDATECSSEADGDVFSNDFRSQNPCGHFLSSIWFEKPVGEQRPRGQIELRLIAEKGD